MKRRLCAAILTFEAVVLGLTTPVLISVQEVDVAVALTAGLGLTALCVVTAGLLRKEWAYVLGWLIQVAAVLLGFEITAMFVLGAVFFALWFAAISLGDRIDRQQRELAHLDEPDVPESRVPPAAWDHELVCGDRSWRSHADRAFRSAWNRTALLWCVASAVVGVLLLFLPGVRIVGAILLATVVLFPGVTWLAQRSAWRGFLPAGRTFRTAFGSDVLHVQVDDRILALPYADITTIAVARGVVSTTLRRGGQQLDLPEEVFPAADRARVVALLDTDVPD